METFAAFVPLEISCFAYKCMKYAFLLIHANPSGQFKVKYLITKEYLPVTFGGILTFIFSPDRENALCKYEKR